MKKSILIITLLLIGLSLFSQPQRIADSDTYWEFRNDTLFITGTGDMPDFENGITPWAFIDTIHSYLEIENGITRIGDHAFTSHRGFKSSLTIPSSVISIGNYAFFCCGFNGSLILSSSITEIGYMAFMSCPFIGDLVLPPSLTEIKPSTFCHCYGFTGSLIIPSSVTTIGEWAFADLGLISSLIIPSSVTTIETFAFRYCTGLDSVVIPSSVNSIDFGAFYGCSGLISLTLPSGLNTIQGEAFKQCSGLKTIINMNPEPIVIDASVFSGVNKSTCILKVDAEYLSLYQQAPVWQDFLIEPLSVKETQEWENSLVIFPNPVKETLNIQTVSTVEQVTFYDITGRIVKQFYNPNQELNISDLPNGLHLIKILTLEGECVRKIIKD